MYIESSSKNLNNNFFRNKINLGLLSYNLKNNEYIDFKILFNDVDENAFDFTILENDEMKIIIIWYFLNYTRIKIYII